MELFQIGEMARLFHLSVSSIRHYETLGLVTPERIDPDTGYRYYSVRQFEAFNTIRYLRTLDMPLPEIADFLRNRDVDKIEEKLQAQKAAVAEKQRELARIEHKIDARPRQLREAQTAPLGEIQLITAPACRLFWMDASLSAENYSDLELSTSRFAAMQAEAVVFLGKVGFSISAAHLKDRRYTQYDGTFLLLDDDDHFDGAPMNCPEALCVRVCFRGHHLQSPDQYRRLSAYMAEHSLAVAGFSREIAVIDQGFTHDRDKFITEICIPVERQT